MIRASAVVRACSEAGVAVVARGAGTSLVGGPVPLAGGIVLSLDRLTALEVDAANTVAVAGAGVITRHLDEAANAHGLMYPPDPASVELSTIGGNVACNSGGLRCVKYGVTADYVVTSDNGWDAFAPVAADAVRKVGGVSLLTYVRGGSPVTRAVTFVHV